MIYTLARLVQPSNAPSPMLVTLFPIPAILTLVRLVQALNAKEPIEFTLSGIVTLVMLHPANAALPICSIELPKVNLERLEQSQNA